jgi:hypothetical protein
MASKNEAIRDMEAAVQSARESLSFAPPEMHDLHWRVLVERLTEIIERKGDD